MIAWLYGKIVDRHEPGKIVIDVNGVGYDVQTSLNTFFQLDNEDNQIGLHVHTIVREDALLLFGFLEKQERSLFRALIKVNGVGPKSAMAILSSITPSEFVACIQQQNTLGLTKLPGIGKKTAERLLIEMHDVLNRSDFQSMRSESPNQSSVNLHQKEAISALEALGYKPQEAVNVIKKLDDSSQTSEQLIRQALRLLAHT